MHIHILGICGTFMGGIARLALAQGHRVTGSDENCYPPMSTQLESLGIALHHGFDAKQLTDDIDCVVVGNALSRGSEVVEALLNSNLPFTSGPEWLKHNILQDKWVVAVAGTHGKTTTASMVAWILEHCGYNPGFLIGGVAENFAVSARLTDSPFFVVEADEYDTAFFDKRSKFVHYRARTCIINNLEFDHADIFADLAAIETQFHHLVRTIASQGLIIRPAVSESIDRVIEKGCWTPQQSFLNDNFSNDKLSNNNQQQTDWHAQLLKPDASEFEVYFQGELQGQVSWPLIGQHNLQNALAAVAACKHLGVASADAIKALQEFKSVKRRMELKDVVAGVTIYEDFAHHPSAIKLSLQALKAKMIGDQAKDQTNRAKTHKPRILAAIDLRSNTMKMGYHQNSLADAASLADEVLFHLPETYTWQINFKNYQHMQRYDCVTEITHKLVNLAQPGDIILLMSNGSFDGIEEKLKLALAKN